MEDGFVSKKRPQILASLAATIGAFGLGTVLGWSSPSLPSLDEEVPSLNIQFIEKSWIASLVFLGAAISCPITGLTLEFFGRKFTILMASLPFCVGWLFIALTRDKLYICIGRFITGFCGGVLSLAVPIYISEITEGDIGSRLASGVGIAITLGILFSYVLGGFVGWKYLAIICALFPLLLGVLMFCMPETPRHLLSKGKLCEASRRLSWLRGAGFSMNVDDELQETKNDIEELRKHGGTWGDFCTCYSIKCLMICLVLMILQQFSGAYAVLFYAVDIFLDTDTGMDVNNMAIALGFANLLATILSTGALDRTGRKGLVIISEVIMAISLGLLGTYFYVTPQIQYYISFIPIVSLMAYISAFSIGLGPVPWIIMREMFPLSSLGFAASITSTVSYGLAFLVTFYFDQLYQEVGNAWCFWTYGIICIIGAAFILYIVPETKGKNVEDIQKGIGRRGANTSSKLAESLKFNLPGKSNKSNV